MPGLLRPSRLMLRLRWLLLLSLPSLSFKEEGPITLIAWLRVLIMCLGSLCMEVLLGLLTIPVSGPEWHRCLPGLFVRCKVPSAKFTSVVLSVDAQTAIHRDIYNHKEYPNHLVTVLAPSHGGGLWVQSGDALPADIRRTPVGEPVGGHVLELGAPISFSAQRWHCVEPWPVDEHRVVLAAYVAGSVERLGAQHRRYLEQLGFNLPSLSGGAAVEQQGGATPCKKMKKKP